MDWSTILAGTQELAIAVLGFMGKGVSVILGVYFIGSGLHKMYAHAKGHRQGEPTVGPVLINLAVGSLMIQFYKVVDMVIHTIFGESQTQPSAILQYMPQNLSSSVMLMNMVQAAALWVVMIGVVAICRGLILLNDLSNGHRAVQGAGWKATWHIIFGAAAVNIAGVVKWFA